MSSILPENLSTQVVHLPWASQGPRFFIPISHYGEMKRYIDAVKRKYPDTVVLVGVDVCGTTGVMFGPERDPSVDEEIVAKFGLTGDNQKTAEQANGPVAPVKTADKPAPTDYMGRGRPAKYPLKSLTKVGDSFIVACASDPKVVSDLKHKLRCASANYFKKYLLEGSCKLEFVTCETGVLVVMTHSEHGDVSEKVEVVYVD